MNPYESLPDKAFWKMAVANRNMFDIDDLWDPKFPIKHDHRVATFGSCFAQHIGRALVKRGFSWVNTEPAPDGLSTENRKRYNYGVFSCRTGNIYTTSQLKQWVDWACLKSTPPSECWEKDGRFYDPFRPNIEPDGFKSEEEVRLSREQVITSFRKVIEISDIFIFTLGLTESWINKKYRYEYPLCPGTIAGKFSANEHGFINQQFLVAITKLRESMLIMKEANPRLRFLLTVSPVPLTATNSGRHVLVATMESKSILRAVAGQLAANQPFVDYFPSYEIINSTPFKSTFFEANQRSVSQAGVNFVMGSFFNGLNNKFGTIEPLKGNGVSSSSVTGDSEDDVVCEEALLEVFGGR